MRNDAFEVAPISGALGAEVRGVDLAALDDDTFGRVHDAFLKHHVLFFRDQKLTPQDQVAFSRRFGDIHRHPYIQGLDEAPDVIEIIKREQDTYVFGGRWHTDQAFMSKPAMATVLYAKEVPPYGGDTMFANMHLAYDRLSDGMKDMLAGIKVHNQGDRTRSHKGVPRAERYANTAMKLKDPGDVEVEAVHPLVRTHPETGRKGLYISSHTMQFDGWTREESEPLLQYLATHATRPEHTCRFRWQVGSLAIWDNRSVQHLALNDYAGFRRVMNRTTIRGDVPF